MDYRRLTMILSIHQPAYLPWLGLLDKIAHAEIYIFLDTVQFEKNSFINRNKIKTSQGPQWLTIPVKMKGHISSKLIDMLIDDDQPWRSKHLKSIKSNYQKSPYFIKNFPKLEELLSIPDTNLSELCWKHLEFWLNEFQIKTQIYRSSSLPVIGKKHDLILNLCKYFSADHYLSGALGADYLKVNDFTDAGIKIEYQEYIHPVYSQLWDNFEPNLSIVDYWMNCGNELNILQREKHGI